VSEKPPRFSIVDPGDEGIVRQAAALLVEGFEDHWPDIYMAKGCR
jgi:hypothetical protein